MGSWNLSSMIVGMGVLLIAVLAIRSMIRKGQSGGCGCGCCSPSTEQGGRKR